MLAQHCSMVKELGRYRSGQREDWDRQPCRWSCRWTLRRGTGSLGIRRFIPREE